jgi:UDP-N-acetylmuramate dehydrogenase
MRLKQNISLKSHSHYRIGGNTKYFAEPSDLAELKSVVLEARKLKMPVFILGGATNLLFGDEGYDGVMIKPKFNAIKLSGSRIEAGASVQMSDLLAFTVRKKLSGLEWAGGLPGTFGGAVRGNAGCFGGEIKDSIVSVKSFDLKTLKVKNRTRKACRFGYRTSIFKEKGNEVILSAKIALKKGDAKKIKAAIDEKIDYRNTRHPMEYPSIGSIFKNVPAHLFRKKQIATFAHVVKTDPFPVVPAAYLISEVNLKGVSMGGAMISPKHPNFIVNVLDAASKDVEHLIRLAKGKVKEKFGITLEEEIMRA